MALTKAQREKRRAAIETELRIVFSRRAPDVTLTVQRGRTRPRVTGRLMTIATSGAFALLDDGGREPLHVPLDAVLRVHP